MSSPRVVGFALFNASTGAPLPGQTPAFLTYKDETGVAITTPTIVEIGGGLYYFVPNFTASHAAAYVIDGGAPASPRYLYDVIRPESFDVDLVSGINSTVLAARKISSNHWKITGNQLIIYDDDKVTPIFVFNLFDDTGTPSMTRIFERTPV